MIGAPPVVAVTGIGRCAGVDADGAARGRRMDGFARAGLLAGVRALASAGYRRRDAADPRSGVFVATSLGCRSSVEEHQRSLSSATSLDDLSPAVFARTVHNTVAGELSLDQGLGGPAETFTSGTTAGIDALVAAFDLLRAGTADRIVVVGAEALSGTCAAGEEAARGHPGPPLEGAGAAVVLESRPAGETGFPAFLLGGTSLFSTRPDAARSRLAAWLAALSTGTALPRLLVASGPTDATFDADALREAGLGGGLLETAPTDLLGTAAIAGAVRAVELLRNRAVTRVAVLVRDPRGPAGAVVLGRPGG